jgi:hypothetical protein
MTLAALNETTTTVVSASSSVPTWAYLLAALVPSLVVLIGVVWQGRKTRNKGTDEHVMARKMLEQHGQQLERLITNDDRQDSKLDRIDFRVERLEEKGVAERAVILTAVEDHVDSPHAGLGEGA